MYYFPNFTQDCKEMFAGKGAGGTNPIDVAKDRDAWCVAPSLL